MKSTPLAIAISIIFALTITTNAWAESTDTPEGASAQAAVEAYKSLFQEVRDAGEWPSAERQTAMINKALADLDISALSLEDMELLLVAMPVVYTSHAATFDALLTELTKDTTYRGACAASLRFRLLNRATTQEQRAGLMHELFQHPGLVEAWKQGKGYDAFGSFGRLDTDQINSLLPAFVELGMADNSEMPVLYFSRMGYAFFAFANAGADDSAAAREPLRISLIDAINKKLQSPDITEEDRETLASTRDRLDGAYAKGQLVNHTAPELNFIWWSNPNDADENFAKLSDLKGKVVVLDFWATWCGPCIGSFPNVKELQEHYEGYDVIIVGVTSLQGAHYPGGGQDKIDTADAPQKEMALMKEFMEAKGVTWRIAFAEQPVYNPDYGVNGIPHVAILDTQGVVRFRGLHPAMPKIEKTSKIDQLLTEAGKPIPAVDEDTNKALSEAATPQGGE